MSKSIFKNKSFLFFILNIFFSVISHAQVDIVGRWKTKDIIGYRDSGSYSLVKEKERPYGRILTFRSDGTFLSDESVECADGCSVFTSGTYVLLDDYHVRMIVEDVNFFGLLCGQERRQKSQIIRDLGVFYIYKEGDDAIRLITSNGDLQDDKDKMLYSQLMESFHNEWKLYGYVWKNTDKNQPEEIIKDCSDQINTINLSNCKIVFTQNEIYGKVFILKENDNFHYVVYDNIKKKVSLAYPKTKS
ncbi:hypothetical protein EYY60_10345 [Flavobacterium zhairuonense]|uniref:hypothetical protein n=1 Tax=Flavobacterium zhairuonense TaxID=2493631 RepID=UPI001043214D|nr:hypothetical protein [Flavobacterium zhairuonense]KAF2510894.1 hypothetical protein EYY60_10345 [Flavobacterium zhairuonense]